jgi:hypothetical protein
MKLRTLWSGKWTRRFVLGGVLILAAIALLCAFLRISRPRDIVVFLDMAKECHPLWRQLALRRVGSGDNAQEFLRRFPPTQREEFGRYGVYHYFPNGEAGLWFTGLSVVTKDDRLVSSQAWSCTWKFVFFDTPDSELETQYAAFLKERSERLRARRESKEK